MNLGSEHYVPCLRWKQGEYQALLRLSSDAKNSLTPLIEIPEIGFDFETRRESKSVDEHLSAFGKRVREKWGKRLCFVDMHLIRELERMKNGQHPFAFVFDDLRSKGARGIPVINLEQDSACQKAIKEITAIDKGGLCIRIGIEEAAKGNIATSLETLIGQYSVEVDEYDFVLDLGAPNFEPIEGFGSLLETLISRLPHLDRWRTFTLIGTSFPRSMGEVKKGTSIIKRNEWLLYKSLVQRLRDSGTRIPTFGDYAINHPDILLLDMRLVKPSAAIRYTIDNGWLIVKGSNVRDYEYDQYRSLCHTVIESNYYSGPTFSSGDKYIEECAQGTKSSGNLTTWRWVGTNHHLEKVVRDIANVSVS